MWLIRDMTCIYHGSRDLLNQTNVPFGNHASRAVLEKAKRLVCLRKQACLVRIIYYNVGKIMHSGIHGIALVRFVCHQLNCLKALILEQLYCVFNYSTQPVTIQMFLYDLYLSH
jgi:hypothetical protein